MFKSGLRQVFVEPESVILLLFLIAIIAIITTMGNMLAPAFASVVIAYLLQGMIGFLERLKVPHVLAVILVYLIFLAICLLAIFAVLPLLWHQATNLFDELPKLLARARESLLSLSKRYPDVFSAEQVQSVIAEAKRELGYFGKSLFSLSIASLLNVVAVVVYAILVPLLIYFFLMDKSKLISWLSQFVPRRRSLLIQVWGEVQAQIGNYVRGKFLEVVIVSLVTYIAFGIMQLEYALLLALAVGLSAIVPYIGAVIVTIPVVVVAFLQWGTEPHFFYLIIIYAIIIAVDGNVLVPLLFAEVMDLHPVAIILAVLFFGGIWGFWGIFFAIPLATVIKAVLTAWPKASVHDE